MSDEICIVEKERGEWPTYWKQTAMTYGLLIGCIGVGIVLDSTALQWIGAIVWLLAIVGLAVRLAKDSYKSPQEAADYLWKKYQVRANP